MTFHSNGSSITLHKLVSKSLNFKKLLNVWMAVKPLKKPKVGMTISTSLR